MVQDKGFAEDGGNHHSSQRFHSGEENNSLD
jgi:hypothetical protein